MLRSCSLIVASVLVAIFVSTSPAQTVTFQVSLNGQNEIIGGAASGDLDGSAAGSITLSPGSGGNTATASWNFTLANLATPPVTDYHIHTGAFNQQGSVFIGFGVQGGDTLNATQFIGSRTGLSSANMTTVLANPLGFYLNLHNGEFLGGAVRGQVPEPTSLAAVALLGAGLLRRKRRA
jgi:hypothetical protein